MKTNIRNDPEGPENRANWEFAMHKEGGRHSRLLAHDSPNKRDVGSGASHSRGPVDLKKISLSPPRTGGDREVPEKKLSGSAVGYDLGDFPSLPEHQPQQCWPDSECQREGQYC